MRMTTLFGAAAVAGLMLVGVPAMAQSADPMATPAGDGAMAPKPMMHRPMMHHRMKMMHHRKMMMMHHRKMMMHKKMM